MTLILGAILPKVLVVAADGLEFGHDPGKQKVVTVTNQRKLFALSGRRVVLAVHGQNRLATSQEGLGSQRLVGEILADLGPKLSSLRKVEGIAHRVLELLGSHVAHTFGLIRSAGIELTPLGISVYGFDKTGLRTEGYEAFWAASGGSGTAKVIRLVKSQDEVRIIHSGTATTFAKKVIKAPGSRFRPDGLRGANVPRVQGYVRGVYRDTEGLLPPGQLPEFGGEYHEVTITPTGLEWTTPRA